MPPGKEKLHSEDLGMSDRDLALAPYTSRMEETKPPSHEEKVPLTHQDFPMALKKALHSSPRFHRAG